MYVQGHSQWQPQGSWTLTGRRLQPVTADFVVLKRHRSTGVAQERVAAVLLQPRLSRLNHNNRHFPEYYEILNVEGETEAFSTLTAKLVGPPADGDSRLRTGLSVGRHDVTETRTVAH
ncbi:hypothetical protein EYF80_026528 [Liparis tanakae]|uniref:Uncharacterized protein n=1 Tax=Liparis tanakae TaxID=230148 RepID=A0A4Z2HBK9_9TELE|nr:hypothetical protein EYF80_026528 [Liparis tanakae]